MRLWPGERLLSKHKANAIITPSDYGLGRVPHGQLLHLVGMAGKEGLGGHLHVTSVRLVFKAHALNRLRGELSTPLTNVKQVEPYRNGLSIGAYVDTSAGKQQYVTWSRGALVASVNQAKAAFGAEEARILANAASEASVRLDNLQRSGAMTALNAAVALFDMAGSVEDLNPLELMTLGAFSASEPNR